MENGDRAHIAHFAQAKSKYTSRSFCLMCSVSLRTNRYLWCLPMYFSRIVIVCLCLFWYVLLLLLLLHHGRCSCSSCNSIQYIWFHAKICFKKFSVFGSACRQMHCTIITTNNNSPIPGTVIHISPIAACKIINLSKQQNGPQNWVLFTRRTQFECDPINSRLVLVKRCVVHGRLNVTSHTHTDGRQMHVTQLENQVQIYILHYELNKRTSAMCLNGMKWKMHCIDRRHSLCQLFHCAKHTKCTTEWMLSFVVLRGDAAGVHRIRHSHTLSPPLTGTYSFPIQFALHLHTSHTHTTWANNRRMWH